MTKKELSFIIEEEKNMYFGKNMKQMKKSKHKRYFIFMYLLYFRKCQYYKNLRQNRKNSKIQRIIFKYKYRYYEKRKNIFSYKSGVEIGLNCIIGQRCNIWHSGVVINGNIGDNCIFHGNNTIGNKGLGNESLRPIIGNNVDIGAGAIIIGDISIADNCIVGAGTVVTKSFNETASVIVGVPGKILKQQGVSRESYENTR